MGFGNIGGGGGNAVSPMELNFHLIGPPDEPRYEVVATGTTYSIMWTATEDGWVTGDVYLSMVNANSDHYMIVNGYSRDSVFIAGGNLYSANREKFVHKGDVIESRIADTSDGVTPANATIARHDLWFIPAKAAGPMFVAGVDLQSSNEPGEVAIDPATKTMSVNGFVDLSGIPARHVLVSDGTNIAGEDPANTDYEDESIRRVTYTTDDIQPGDPSPYQPGTLTCVYE